MAQPVVVIPFVDRLDLTRPLVDRLAADGEYGLLMLADNGSTDPATRQWVRRMSTVPGVSVVRYPKVGETYQWAPSRTHSLYRCWNLAITWALRQRTAAVILNNDVEVPVGFVGDLVGALASAPADVAITYPDTLGTRHPDPEPITRTRGLWPDGMTPFAFALDPTRVPGLPPIDERFVLYCGDVELLWMVQARGCCAARVNGLHVTHRLGATRKAGQWADVIAADRAHREDKYPHGPGDPGLLA